jgi:putative ABC transport system permease protein
MKPGWTSQIEVPGRPQSPGERDEVRIRGVGPDYFRTIGVPVVAGRAIDGRDRQGAPPVVAVNRAFARKYFPGGIDPIGRTVRFWGVERQIVGIVGDVRFRGVGRESEPAIYPSILQVPVSGLSIVARSKGEAFALVPELREAIRQADPDVALFEIRSADDLVSRSIGAPRFQTTLLSVFGGAALLLASLGLYGLLAYSVARRTREIGIRSALGAGRTNLIWLVLREGLGRCLAGLAVGIVASLGAGRLLSGMLYGVQPTDAAVLAAVAAVLGVVSLAASYLPARRAARVDPITALRSE